MNEMFENISNLSFSDEEAREYISMLFEGYEKRKKENRLYSSDKKNDNSNFAAEKIPLTPVLIIWTYYSCVKKPEFDKVVYNFKKRYIYNESKVEDVHTKSEMNGLGAVYDYIQTKENLADINLYTLTDIHEILYSKTTHPEFGGKYRVDDVYLPGTGIDLTSHDLIVHEMNKLKDEINELVQEGLELGKNNDISKIIPYIDKCVELKCKLIKIHPFNDGNGRSIRAFINLLFRLANIPPIYIENKEKTKYHEAMNKAMGDEATEQDLRDIKGFYYYKICDSMIQLDLVVRNNKDFKDDSSESKKKETK